MTDEYACKNIFVFCFFNKFVKENIVTPLNTQVIWSTKIKLKETEVACILLIKRMRKLCACICVWRYHDTVIVENLKGTIASLFKSKTFNKETLKVF